MRSWAKVGALALLVAAVGAGVCRRPSAGPLVSEGATAPAFRLATLAGDALDSQALLSGPVVLNFWATWCAPCVEELPSLERLHRALGPEGLRVVALSQDDDPVELRRFVARHGLTLAVARDAGHAVASAYGVEGLPTTFVIESGGRVRGAYVGVAEWDTPGALRHMRRLLTRP